MARPELAPRRTIGGVIAVWVVAAVIGVVVSTLVVAEWRAAWIILGLGACVVLSFAVQLTYGRSQQFIERVAVSALGAVLILGLISAAVGLASIVAR